MQTTIRGSMRATIPSDVTHCYISSVDEEEHVPDYLSQESAEGHLQQRFRVMCQRQLESFKLELHDTYGHCHAWILLDSLEVKGIPHKHLKKFVLYLWCTCCDAALGEDQESIRAR